MVRSCLHLIAEVLLVRSMMRSYLLLITSALELDSAIERIELLINSAVIDAVVICLLVVLVLFGLCEAYFDPMVGLVIVDGCFWIGLFLMK
jgi:hypothetical protein